MRKPRFSKGQTKFECEIGYSQSTILFDILLGLFLVVGGIVLACWIKSWTALFWPLLGLFSMWQAMKRMRNQGPQLKIGYGGIWTAKTGILHWRQALPIIKREISYRSVLEYLVILNHVYPNREMARLSTRELDVESRELRTYLNKYSFK